MASKASQMLAALLASALIGSFAKPVGNLRGADGAKDSGLEVPDVSGLPDTPGPYQEEPNNTDAEKPKAAMVDWRAQVPNATQGSLGSLLSLSAWQEHQFCNLHKTGFFCENSTRIRCCKLEDGYAKCGSTANSSACSQQKLPEEPKSKMLKTGAGWWHGMPGFWHIHPGWHVSSFCQSHHVGSFCRSHHVIHCCNDYGHFVECNTQYHDSGYFC
ncbi:Pomgnt1 [Symbiodinium sp. CCMP2592]|nr:Pomgnt1 [Symbiodinium sp. CCMP2592]